MVAVPEYLLKRSQARRAELSGEASVAPSGDAPASSSSATQKVSVSKTLAPIAPSAPPPEIQIPESVKIANARLKIPFWVLPVLLFIPIWAFIYVGTLEEPTRAETGLLADGRNVYESVAACATCHGTAGAGTNAGPPLKDEALLGTFPDENIIQNIAAHIEWVIKATDGTGIGNPYGAPEQGRVAGWFGDMPGFQSLTPQQLLEVVLYERAVIAGSESSKTVALQIETALNSGTLILPEQWSSDITIEEILNDIQPAFDAAEPEG